MEMTEAEATNLLAKLNPESGELSDHELEIVSGGCGEKPRCPDCGSYNIEGDDGGFVSPELTSYRCRDCYRTF